VQQNPGKRIDMLGSPSNNHERIYYPNISLESATPKQNCDKILTYELRSEIDDAIKAFID
jgi:hypothetical protein